MLAITGFGVSVIPDAPANPWAFITPGSGSFTIGTDVYTLDAAGNAKKNGVAIPGGNGTSRMALLGGKPYGQDSGGSGWYLWNGSTWVAQGQSASGSMICDNTGWLFTGTNGATAVTMTGVGGQIAFNGVTDTITAHVFLVLWVNGVLWQKVTQPGQASTLLGASITYGPDDTTNWNSDLNGFTAAMGQAPSVFNTFVDSGSDWMNVDTQGQWTAAEIVKGAPSPKVPVVALPLAVSSDTTADSAFLAVAAGSHDAAINDILNAYKTNGYTTICIRPGWEFDGSWFKWSVTPANQVDFVAAFKHVANLAHAFVGMTIKVIWEPNYGSPYNSGMYPGNSYVDLIGLDGAGAGSGGPAVATVNDTSGTVWSFAMAAQVAIQNNKPTCADELIDAPADVPAFAAAIAQAWKAQTGLVVDHFSILNDPSQAFFSNDANASAAWRSCFANIATGMNWYSYNGTPGSWTGPTTTDPRQTGGGGGGGGTTGVNVINGQITLNGVPKQFRGINIYFDGGGALTDAGVPAVLNTFPKLFKVRINCFDYPSAATLAPYINALTAAGVVCEIEDHNYPPVLTGTALTNSANWYASLATAFNSNPLVMYGTQNEPDPNGSGGWGAVVTEIQTIYHALRNAGYQGMIMVNPAGGWSTQGFTAANFAGFVNCAWDLHFYAWVSHNSTDVPTVTSYLNAEVANAQATMNWPVVIGEYGPSSGVIVGDDVGGDQVTQAVQQSSYSSDAWAWTSGNPNLPLLLNSTSGDPSQGLTANFGVPTKAFIQAGT